MSEFVKLTGRGGIMHVRKSKIICVFQTGADPNYPCEVLFENHDDKNALAVHQTQEEVMALIEGDVNE